ncbi:MAG: putative 2-aminoethylphosphonate ABC transporter substrate-binding protein [Candidatus Adiutrix sp.]|nr:putative 2-aminoethylphosphonate ABC transporter substrate-binding protein [Candidatus Adiutrix sp.]
MKKFISILGVLGFLILGAGTAPAADEDKSIIVYTALEDELVTEYLEDFKRHHPDLTVSVVRESTGIITARLLAEKDQPQADVVWGTAASSMMILDNLGLLAGYAPAGVNRILPRFKSTQEPPTWVGIDAWETAFTVNTEELAKAGLKASDIKTYQDLLNPKLKGQIVMSNPSSSGTGFLTVSAILQLNGKDSEAGWDFLTALDRNVDQYVHSGSKPAKMAAAGECAVGISFGYAGLSQKKNSPVEIVFPAEGSGWDLEANALMKKPRVKPAARTFLDWAISDSVMELYRKNYPIVTIGVKGGYEGIEGDPIKQLIDNDFAWAAGNRDTILKKWAEKFDAKSAPK